MSVVIRRVLRQAGLTVHNVGEVGDAMGVNRLPDAELVTPALVLTTAHLVHIVLGGLVQALAGNIADIDSLTASPEVN